VATAAVAASWPLSSREPGSPARSSAWASSSHVRTPKPTGTPVLTATSVSPDVGGRAETAHVFITDEDLHFYEHIRAVRDSGGKYTFKFTPPDTGKYRLEIVFETAGGWMDFRKDIKIKEGVRTRDSKKTGDEGYQIKLKLIPGKAYAEHVVTFLYEITYKGKPLKGIEKMEGSDMHVAAWDEDLKEFIYATPKQNLGGPEVAVSFVFMKSGKHVVFAEFKDKGVVRKIDFVLNVFEEPREDRGAIFQIKPSD